MKGICAVLMAAAVGAFVHAAFAAGLPRRARDAVARRWSAARAARQRRRLLIQWPQALLFLAGALQAGTTLDEAFDSLAREAPEPMRSHLGRPRGPALTSERRVEWALSDPVLRFPRAALLLYLRAGGRVGRLLETAASVLQERVEAEARVRALTAQGRASAWIVALTPLGLGAALSALAPDLAAPLVQTGAGRCVLLVAAALVVVGLWWAQRLARVEP